MTMNTVVKTCLAISQTHYPDVHLVAEACSALSAGQLTEETLPGSIFLSLQSLGNRLQERNRTTPDPEILIVFVPQNSKERKETVERVLALIQLDESEGKKLEDKHAVSEQGPITEVRYHEALKPERGPDNRDKNGKIVLPTSEGLILQKTAEIIRLESDNNYTTVVRNNLADILLTKTLKDFEAVLDQEEFLRVHNSHIINISCLQRFDKRDGGFVVMSDESRVPVSRRRQRLLLEKTPTISTSIIPSLEGGSERSSETGWVLSSLGVISSKDYWVRWILSSLGVISSKDYWVRWILSSLGVISSKDYWVRWILSSLGVISSKDYWVRWILSSLGVISSKDYWVRWILSSLGVISSKDY